MILPILALLAAAPTAWERIASADGSFSAETPCPAASAAAGQRGLPGAPGGVDTGERTRIMCIHRTATFLAYVVSEPGTSPLFDRTVASLKADASLPGTSSAVTIDRHRAYLNRLERGGAVAQTGFVEVDAGRVLAVVANVPPDEGLSPADRAATVDRFFNSIKVTR